MLSEEHQRPASLFNRIRCRLSFHSWERVRCHDCEEDRLVRQALEDRDAPAQECGECGSPSLWPIERQSSAAFCPGCEHDLLHQEDATVKDRPGVAEITCQYCGTPSSWLLSPPAPIRVDVENMQ